MAAVVVAVVHTVTRFHACRYADLILIPTGTIVA